MAATGPASGVAAQAAAAAQPAPAQLGSLGALLMPDAELPDTCLPHAEGTLAPALLASLGPGLAACLFADLCLKQPDYVSICCSAQQMTAQDDRCCSLICQLHHACFPLGQAGS